MDELATKLVDSLTKVETALETMAPTAFQALVEAAYVGGIISITQGFLLALIAFAGARMVLHGLRKTGGEAIAYAVGGGIAAVIPGIIAIVILFSINSWLRVITPTAYVIKSLLNQ